MVHVTSNIKYDSRSDSMIVYVRIFRYSDIILSNVFNLFYVFNLIFHVDFNFIFLFSDFRLLISDFRENYVFPILF